MVYVTPVPAAFVSGQYYEEAGNEYYLSPAKLEADYSPVRFEREIRLFRSYCSAGAVLDVGCSSGAFLYHLNRSFPGDYETLGMDRSSAPLDYAESRAVRVVRGDFLSAGFGGRTFDAISFWAVMEHLLEPRRFLDRAYDLLKPGGICFVLVPNFESFAVRMLGPRYRYIYPQHLNYFTRKTIMTFCGSSFEARALRSMHFNPVVIWQDWRRHGREVSNTERANLLSRTTRYKSLPLLKPLKWVYAAGERFLGSMFLADNIVIVLEKPQAGSKLVGTAHQNKNA
jgi:SAM-dependent methyltransferase